MGFSGLKVLTLGSNGARLLEGLWVTVRISLISVALSLFLGLLVGVLMNSEYKVIRWLTKFYLELVRIMPQLVLLFIVYFGFTTSFGLNLSGELAAIAVFTFWGSA